MKNFLLTLAVVSSISAVAEPSLYDLELAEDIRLDGLADKMWQAAVTPEEVAALQERVLADATAAIGGFPERTPLETRKVGEERFDGYRVEKLVFASRPNYHVPCHLYLPDDPEIKPPYPVILMPCGHDYEGKSEPIHARAAVVAAKAGFAALLCDPIDQGERRFRDGADMDNVFGHREAGLRAHLLGEGLAQYRIWDGIRAIDMLCERDDIDATRIGCTGFSGGGTMTSYMNMFDKRITCAAPMAFITSMTELAKGPGPQDSEQVIFGQLKFGLNHLAFLTMRAPNPILPAFSYDDFFPYAGSEATFAKAAEWYAKRGYADRIDHLECPGRHGWYESERFGLVKWMDRWLNGNTAALPFDREALNALNAREKDRSPTHKICEGVDYGLGMLTDPRALCCNGSVRRLAGEKTIFDLLTEKAAAIEQNRGPLTPDIVRKVVGIWENIPGAKRPETVHCEFSEGADGAVTMSATDAIAYERGVKDFWYSLKGPAEELAAMMMWRGENLIARKTDEILWAAQQYYYGHAKTPVFMKADGAAVIAAAHAYYLCPEYFTGIEITNPPPSWKEAFTDPYLEIGAADVIYGAYWYYDWPDLLDASKWIEPVAPPSADHDTAVFRGEVVLGAVAAKAEWTIASMGVCRLFVNGHEVGADDWLKPGITHVDKRRLSYTYDVTPFLNNDPKAVNILEAEVSASWWRDQVCNAPIYRPRHSSGFKANLACTMEGGATRYFTTGEGWKADYTGPVKKASIFDGEEYDARETAEVKSPAKINGEFTGVIVPHGSSVYLRRDLALEGVKAWVWNGVEGATDESFGRVKKVREYKLGERMELKKGETLVIDFGQNCAGVPEFVFSAKKGVRLGAASAEMLNDANGEKSRGNDGPAGSVYRANYRLSKSELGYTFAGAKEETYIPRHTFFGGRYWSVTADGKVDITKVTFIPLTSLAKASETLELTTGREDLNRLVQNSIWGMRSNYLSIPTDCPQRDERQGWTGDTQAYIGAAVWNADVRAFHRKWMADMRDSQMGEDEQYPGSYREVAPPGPAGVGGHRIGWSDAGVIVPYEVWKQFGDARIVRENWESMAKFMALIAKTGYHTYPNDYQSADWLSMEKFEQRRWFERSQPADESEAEKRLYWDLLGSAYRIRDLGMMIEMGEAIGRGESVNAYRIELETAKEDFRARFLDGDGVLIGCFRDMQTPNLFVQMLGLSPDEKARAANRENLIASIKENGYRIKTGFLGTSIILDTLVAMGDGEVAYNILLNEDFPGWIYSINQGATTIWERWNSYTKDNGFGPVGMNSFNHYAYGAVEGWMVRNMAGIQPGAKGGFEEFTLAPIPDRRVGSVKAVYHSTYGDIASEWKYDDEGRCRWRFTIPIGTKAMVKLPDGTAKEYQSGTFELEI